VVVERPGVGEGLQDRYEVGVVWDMPKDFRLLEGATFQAPGPGRQPDRFFEQWERGGGVYTTNGALLGVIKKSAPERPLPDLFLFALPAHFKGYFKGYSQLLSRYHDAFTWAILKAHTKNSAGYVRLRSADPRDVPEINFRYFEEGNDTAGEDLASVVAGVRFARSLMARADGATELVPGPDVRSDEDIADFVRREAWGHHACGTCRMGPATDPMTVVDTNFRVHGTEGLRVVDASVFPRIPGFFIVSAVYMLAEKASDVILADVGRPQRAAARINAARSRVLGAVGRSRREGS
jgi:choline dehydrogenase